jgi:hypothetical protein
MLTSDAFSSVLWDILHKSEGDSDKLRAILAQLDKETIELFFNEYIRAASNLIRSQLASYLGKATYDMKKDTYEYIVAQGKDTYDELIRHPERVPQDVDSNDVWVKGVAIGVYWDRFQEHIPRYD